MPLDIRHIECFKIPLRLIAVRVSVVQVVMPHKNNNRGELFVHLKSGQKEQVLILAVIFPRDLIWSFVFWYFCFCKVHVGFDFPTILNHVEGFCKSFLYFFLVGTVSVECDGTRSSPIFFSEEPTNISIRYVFLIFHVLSNPFFPELLVNSFPVKNKSYFLSWWRSFNF